MKYVPGGVDAAKAWQHSTRAQLLELLHLTDLIKSRENIPLEPHVTDTFERSGFTQQTIQIRSTPGRTITVIVAKPKTEAAPLPAVVAIHGHQGSRMTPFSPDEPIYKLFGTELARHGFVVISTDIGQHEVYETGRPLMGERLWDLMRCVDYLETLDYVDHDRIGCAGLSLGGELAMWLGAMDERIAATVSAGFLTYMDQMEFNHCMCWKFDGLRERVDFPDIYSLIAPRPLQCQNGLREPETQFPVALAQKALKEIKPAYRDFGVEQNVELAIHNGAHEIALDPMLAFLTKHLKGPHPTSAKPASAAPKPKPVAAEEKPETAEPKPAESEAVSK